VSIANPISPQAAAEARMSTCELLASSKAMFNRRQRPLSHRGYGSTNSRASGPRGAPDPPSRSDDGQFIVLVRGEVIPV
jgi:hypothetical protein